MCEFWRGYIQTEIVGGGGGGGGDQGLGLRTRSCSRLLLLQFSLTIGTISKAEEEVKLIVWKRSLSCETNTVEPLIKDPPW